MAKFKNWYMLFFILFGLLTFAPSARAEFTIDHQCTQVGTDYDLISDGTTPREQSFIPTQNRLSMVHTWLNGPGFAGDQGVKVSILDASRQLIGSVEYNPTFTNEEPQIRTAEFEPALTLVPGQTYYIQVDTMEGPNNLYWYYGNQTCYANGTGFAEFTEAAWDYTFQTYGYTYTEPSNNTTPTTTTTPTSTTTPAPDSTPEVSIPKTTTSSSIKPPTNLNAVYDKEKSLIVLNWTASTTSNIDGYILSRSEDNQTFSDLGMVSKSTLSYSDLAIVAEKSYFYKVRAYKATLSSTTTDSVSVAVPAAEIARAESAVDLSSDSTNQQPKESFFSTQNIIIIIGLVFVVLLAILEVMLIKARRKGVKLSELFKRTN
jgi:hypothetical protein